MFRIFTPEVTWYLSGVDYLQYESRFDVLNVIRTAVWCLWVVVVVNSERPSHFICILHLIVLYPFC